MKTLVRGIRSVAHGIGIDVIRYRDPSRWVAEDLDPVATSVWQRVRGYTMTSPQRIVALLDAVRYLVRNDIAGDLVECGVWRGGSMMAVALQLLELGVRDRKLHLFDTFEGMAPPTEVDVDPHGTAAVQIFGASGRGTNEKPLPWKPASMGEVRTALGSTGYPDDQVHLIKGKIEDTVPAAAPQSIALLRLDTDWYESTRHELEHLFPRLVDGGVLIIDDYGYWKGSRKAVDEYIERNAVPLLLFRVDDAMRIAIVRKR
jgi:hypothetical protein